MFKKLTLFLSLAVLLGLMTACGGAAPAPETTTEEEPAAEEAAPVEEVVEEEAVAEEEPAAEEAADSAEPITLRTVIGNEPPTMDPALSTDTTSVFFVNNMFVGLTGFDEQANVVPSLATDWSVSEDGLTWTFNLRDDIQWVQRNADTGEIEVVRPVTAQDVVYGVKRTLNPETASDYAYVLYAIDGAEALNTAETSGDDLTALLDGVGVSAPDDTTVEFTLTAPAAYFPSIAGMWVTYPQPQEAIEEYGNEWTEPGNIITNGPYTLQTWTHGAEVFIEKNPHWINADEVQIEVVGGPIIPEESTALSLYENGEIDMLASPPGWGPPPTDLDRIRADEQLSEELFIAPQLCTYYYGFVNTKPPFDDANVRKAFSLAIDRTGIVENVTKGGQTPAHSFAPPGVFGNVADNFEVGGELVADYGERLEQAQALLAEAGYPDGEGLDVVLAHNTSEAHAQIAQAVQAMWQEAFPQAQISIENQEWAVYLDTLEPGAPDDEKPNVYRLGWCADYPDSNNWLNDVFNSQSGSNYAKFNNEEFDSLVTDAAFESESDTRLELYTQAEEILVEEEAAIAPIYYYTYVRMYKPWVTPVINPVGGDPIDKWELDVDAQQAGQ